jgi:PhnB protein
VPRVLGARFLCKARIAWPIEHVDFGRGRLTRARRGVKRRLRTERRRPGADSQMKGVSMPQPIAYLAFDGHCAEAMRFYERALGGRIEVMMSNAESPWAAQMPPGSAQRILHACLALDGNGYLYAGDCPQNLPYEGIKGVSLTVNYDTVERAQQVFSALAEGGQVTMPLQPAFWAKTWGMLIDRFGTPWIVNGERIAL